MVQQTRSGIVMKTNVHFSKKSYFLENSRHDELDCVISPSVGGRLVCMRIFMQKLARQVNSNFYLTARATTLGGGDEGRGGGRKMAALKLKDFPCLL